MLLLQRQCKPVDDAASTVTLSVTSKLFFNIYMTLTVLSDATEGLCERTEHHDIFLFSAHHSMVFSHRCSGWLVGWGLVALSAQIGHIVPSPMFCLLVEGECQILVF